MPDEVFTFLLCTYDISTAHKLVHGRIPNGSVAVRAYYEGVIVPGLVDIDEDYAYSGCISLDEPLIMGTMADGTHLVLDGYHRIAHAYFCGVETLPCHVLSHEETARIVLYDGSPYWPRVTSSY